MAEIVQLVAPAPLSLSFRVFRAVCFAEGRNGCCCKSADLCWAAPDDDVARTLSALADTLAGDDALAREIGRDAVSAVVRRIREGM